MKARWIVEPLRLLDCFQNNEGGACIIVSSADRAKDARKKPVYLSGMQGVHAGRQYHNLTLPGLGVAQQDVFTYEPDDLSCRSEEHTYELQSLMRNSYAVFCLQKKTPKRLKV